MSSTRLFPAGGAAPNCVFCACLGLSGERLPVAAEMLDWLCKGSYAGLVYGCAAESNSGVRQGGPLSSIRIHHDLATLPKVSEGCAYWLVVKTLLPEMIAVLEERDDVTVIWIPERVAGGLSQQLRFWPRQLASRLHLHWPHFRHLQKWGWTWEQLINEQRVLWASYPHLRRDLPPGWDLSNPEVDSDLDLEPQPEFVVDRRTDHSPDLSVIIPTYNSLNSLVPVVNQILSASVSCRLELIVCDDGSDDGTRAWLESKALEGHESRLVYVKIARPRPRQMGEGGFRAGIARNVAATLSRGKNLLFLDADILVPASFLNELPALHEHHDLIQATRQQLGFEASADRDVKYDEIKKADLEPSGKGWTDFERLDWNHSEHKWKFASTYCLSLKRSDFFRLGAFRRSFNKYGFEDTDLGFRAYQAGLVFFRSPTVVYHFKHALHRSEFKRQASLKDRLLRNSARVFFLNNPHPEVLEAVPQYVLAPLKESRLWPW